MVWGPGEYIDTAKKLVERFNAENPGIKVTYQSTPWSSWPQVFTTAIGSGTAPDISTGGGFQPVKFYAESDAILTLDDVYEEYKKDGQIDDFAAGTVDANFWDNHYIGVPWNLDIRSTFYRKDLFDAVGGAPKNWDELRTSLKKVTKDKVYGYGFAGNSPLSSQQMMTLMYNNGGGLFTADGKVDLLSDRNVETFEFIGSLIKDGVVHPASAGWNENDLAKA
jgi:multiple sugar transport system substrate-binding protein